ncbi:MAG: HEXXH motif-containing putative peptide modification protein [Allosphingosinicella sp.]
MTARARVLAAIAGTSTRWYPSLAPQLADAKWDALATLGLNSESYGTTRMITADPFGPRRIEGTVEIDGREIKIEEFSDAMEARYASLGIASADAGLVPDAAIGRLSRALKLLEHVPGLSLTIGALVRSLHLIRVGEPEYDASYSDPEVPFSIFIGLHPEATEMDAFRLAESVVHEAMHLQLSLIEAQVPLVAGARTLDHSPWQDGPRPAQGLLHGLYVFRAIQDFLAAIPSNQLDEAGTQHVRRRVALIDDECEQLAGFDQTSDLTAEGRMLAAGLLLGGRYRPTRVSASAASI